jgi:hypothetical protein
VLLYRVFPYPLFIWPKQGTGRWDNPALYLALYVASSPTGAIGEMFAANTPWEPSMLELDYMPGAERALVTFRLDEDKHPLLDLDDAPTLARLGIKPTDVVIRNRPKTQGIARKVYEDGGYAGLSWWSTHRPQWTLHVLWNPTGLEIDKVEPIAGHPGLLDAAGRLYKAVDPALLVAPRVWPQVSRRR